MMEAINQTEPLVEETPAVPASRFWPEAWRTQQRERPFPYAVLITWVLPGIVASLLLLGLLYYLFIQSNKRIVHVSPSGELTALRADGDPTDNMEAGWLRLSAEGRETLFTQTGISALGYPQASTAGGRELAITRQAGEAIQVSILSTVTGSVVSLTSNHAVVPHNGWSADDNILAVVDYDGSQPILSLIDMRQEDPQPIHVRNHALHVRAGLDWHPERTSLLITQQERVDSSRIARVSARGETTAFVPSDGEVNRADAVWSPDGSQIAYIGVQSQLAVNNQTVPAGTLWVANSDGSNPRHLVRGNAAAPIWHERDWGYIYFVQEISNTLRFQRVSVAGANIEEIGTVPDAFLTYPFDRELFFDTDSTKMPPFTLRTEPRDPSFFHGFKPNQLLRLLLRGQLPLLANPRWSPDGSRLAATIWEEGKIQAAVYSNNLQATPSTASSSVSDVVAVPSDGWSPDSNHLALLEKLSDRTALAIYNVQSPPTSFDFAVDTRAGLSWNSATNELLITAVQADTNWPILQSAFPDGTQREFARADNQKMRADAAWSPDGEKVVYVASNTYTTTQDILYGNLWLADSTGTATRQITTVGKALAPVWSPDGDAIFFTRLDPASNQFELYRIPFLEDGSTGEEHHVGASSEAFLDHPFDRNLLLQWSPDGDQLLLTSDARMQPPSYQRNVNLTSEIQASVPLVGAIRWSPNGSRFAAPQQSDDGKIVTVIYDLTGESNPIKTPTEDYDLTILPADGWSPSSTQIALVRQQQGEAPQIGFINPAAVDTAVDLKVPTSILDLDARAGISWEPNERFLLVTALDEGITPTLYTINPSNDLATEKLIPDDGQLVHGDAAFSPDGERIAYVATNNISETLEADLLAGSLWLANADGTQARQVVASGLNLAPIWTSDDDLFFTRFVPDSNSYELYHLEIENSLVRVQYRGPSTAAFANFPFDRQLFLTWTENGRRWDLTDQDYRPQQVFFLANADGSNLTPADETAQCLETDIPFAARWAPTSRALLVACPTGSMKLHWLNSNRENESLTRGIFPTWEP